MLTAADLLADARVANICWNGTSAGWLGFERDRALCDAILQRTGIQATSSVLALDALFRKAGVRRFGLVTPYTDDVQQRIVETFRAEGFECVAERHTGEHVNFAFAEVSPAQIAAAVREVAAARPDAIAV
jgi:maleate isomerase